MMISYLRRKPVPTRNTHCCESPDRWWRTFINWLFDSLMPGVPVISTVGASSLKSPASIWRGVVFVTFIVSMMAIFAGNQVQAANVYERFAGIVVDQVGPLADATVEVNGLKKQTSDDGSFEVYALRASRYTINVTKSGYALVSKIENYLYGNANLRITVKQAEVFQISDPSIENTVVDSRGTKIVLPANALVDANGNKPTGPISVVMYTYDLANEQMPGDMSAVNSANQSVYLESAGAFFAEFVDASGKKYDLADDQQATISVPAINTEATVDLWYYDEANGVWREDGTAVLINGRFEGKVSHFSTWNFDWEKTKPGCVLFKIEQSLINTYGVGSAVLIKAKVTPPIGYSTTSPHSSTRNFPIGSHTLYNIPVNSTVEFFIPPTSTTAYATVNSNAYITGSYGALPPNTSVCGQITLAYPKIELDKDGYACIEGKGKGLGFSWKLTQTPLGGSETLVAAIAAGQNPKNAMTVKGDSENTLVYDLIGDIKNNTGVFLTQFGNCIDLNNTYTIYVGLSGQTANMCNVRTTSGGCSFNPNIKFVSKEKMFSSINGFVWNDSNADGIKGNGEESRQAWTVTLTDSSGSKKTAVTDENGHYQFAELSQGDYTVAVETRADVVYTTAQSVMRKVDLVRIPRAVSFGIKDAPQFDLTVSKTGEGVILGKGIQCGTDCNESYPVNIQAALTASPANGFNFADWTGACTGTNPNVTVMMDANKTCTAHFVPIIYQSFAGTVNPSGAMVEINGVETQTDNAGAFNISVPKADQYVVNVTENGYALVSQIEYAPNDRLEFTLKKAEVYPIDSSQASEVEDSRGTRIKLPANALVDSNGNLPTGPVNVTIYTYDLANEPMPGDMSGITLAGEQGYLQSAGAFFAEFTDASGKKYNLAVNQKATISLPAMNTEPSVGLWSYDEADGIWKEEASANLVDGRYVGDVSHFSAWNFDWHYGDPACVKLEIEQSFFDAYKDTNGDLTVKAVVTLGSYISSRNLSMGSNFAGPHVLYNLPPNATVNFYAPPSFLPPAYDTVNAGAAWGGTGYPPYPYNVCNGNIKLAANSVKLVAVSTPACNGNSFDVTIQAVIDNSQPVDTVSVVMNFDPATLQVNSVTNSGVLDFEMINTYGSGSIQFTAGVWGNPVQTQTFDLFTVNFTALQPINTTLTFDTTQSAIVANGVSIPYFADNGQMTISDCSLKYQVDLQRTTPKPDASWITALDISLGTQTSATKYPDTCDSNGQGSFQTNSPLGSNDYICVKNAHTLANKVVAPIDISNIVNFGLLLEGDANGDNYLTASDFSLVHASKGKCTIDTGYNANADFNVDGCVTRDDAKFLISAPIGNFGKTSVCAWDANLSMLRRSRRDAAGTVTLGTTAIPTGLTAGDSFDYAINVQAGTQFVDTASAYINFDPEQLQVNHLTAGDKFDFVLQKEFDNTNGHINFAAGVWDNAVPDGTFTLVTINMTVLQVGGEETLSFNTTAPRQSEAASGGKSVISEQGGEVVTIAPASCQIYAVNDKGLNNSQFFTVSLDDFTVSELGSMYEGHDIESLAIHPETNMIYAASGDDVTNGKPGHFYRVDGETGALFPVDSTEFNEIEDLAFSPDGTLYAWAKGDGLITINDLTTGKGTLIFPYSDPLIEGLTLKKNDGNVFFGAVGTDLWQFDMEANTLEMICPNKLLGETEALEIMPDGLLKPDGLLLIGTHNVPFGLHAFNTQTCEVIEADKTLSNKFDDVEGIAVPVKDCSLSNIFSSCDCDDKTFIPDCDDCGGGTCASLAQEDLQVFETIFMEPFVLYMAIRSMVVADYDIMEEWPIPLSNSITPPTGNYTAGFTTGEPPLYIEATMRSQAELEAALAAFNLDKANKACLAEVAGKVIRFIFNPDTRIWSCSVNIPNGVPPQHLDLFPMKCD